MTILCYTDAFHLMQKLAETTLKWSSSFGYLGENGFAEYWRAPDGTRYVISNGTWCEYKWTVRAIYATPFDAHVLDFKHGPRIESFAEMHAAMCWAERGVRYASV
jgi:hypothetical protein